MKVAGLDGYKKGWVAVFIEGDKHTLEFLPSLQALLVHNCDSVMIDIPIGLPTSGNRECDLLAKKLLGVGSSRVFTGVRRNYWRFADRLSAQKYYESTGDKGVSCQLWCLRGKIKEADAFITPDRQSIFRETHPELAFWRLNGGQVLPPKKEREGVNARRELLRSHGFNNINDWLDKRRIGTGAKVDDVLDACACALVALSPSHRTPAEPPRDDKGLRMEIWY